MEYSYADFLKDMHDIDTKLDFSKYTSIYGVPRGGQIFANELHHKFHIPIVPNKKHIRKRTLIVDDVVDSGDTLSEYPDNDFLALHVKTHAKTFPKYFLHKVYAKWIKYWWEENETVEGNITRLIQIIGDDPKREGLKNTPRRVIKSYRELFRGYDWTDEKIEECITTFTDEEDYDEIILLKDIEFYSTCEHHLLPFFGKAHIAYIPNKSIVGISKLARLLEVYSRRLQIQERIGTQIINTLDEMATPRGSACILEAQHLCMIARGVNKQNSIMVTSALSGVFRDKIEARQELMRLIK